MSRPAPYGLLAEFRTPAEIVKAAEAVAAAVPGAKQAVLKGQTHNVAPGVLTPAVVEFFREAR